MDRKRRNEKEKIISIQIKYIIGFESKYTVDEYGSVYSILKSKNLKPYIDKDGYAIVTLTKNSRSTKFKVHRLVAMLFLENYNKDLGVNHKDFNKLNNHYTNLEVSSCVANQRHKWNRNNTVRYGICKHKGKWRTSLKFNNKPTIEIGVFASKEEAYQAFYNKYLEYYGIPPWDEEKINGK